METLSIFINIMYLLGLVIAFLIAQFIVWAVIPTLCAVSEHQSLKEWYAEVVPEEEWFKTWFAMTIIGSFVSLLSWVFVFIAVVVTGCIYAGFKLESSKFLKPLGDFLKEIKDV